MKFNTLLILALMAIIIGGCAGEGSKNTEKQQKPLITPPAKTNATKPARQKADPNLGKKAKSGFTNKFERGQKRRETIQDKFDDQGNMIERTDKMFDEFGEVKKKNRYTYKYDDAGRRIEQWYIATTKNDEPIMSNVNHLTYNEKGWKSENIFISYGADGVEKRWVKNEFKYNNQGRIIEDVTINKEGLRQLTVIYNIVNGELVSENFIKYDENGEPLKKQTLTYDKFGTVTSTKDESLK